MRTRHRRSLALAATCLPALLGLGLVAGATPAAASTTGADCGATSTGPDGQLDGDLLQACLLDQIHSSLASEDEPALVAAVESAEVYEEPVYALDVVLLDLEVEAEIPVEEAAPVDQGWDVWAALRDCESGGDYGIDTGNGYYGAYQFSLETWQGLGYGGYPHEASPATQDQAASELQYLYGWSQWPSCSWYLGLI
ncbi:MAG TPA: transglycosylase family protein [Acidimicrobiales bacterium]|nr:transglycosylase family protein [Acidimicrobiales bacterium]